MIFSDLHSHSLFSDGKTSIREMLQGALEKGLLAYGISDHSHTPEDESYCMKKEALPVYLAECRELKKEYAGRIEFYCGLEKDALSEVDPERFDYLIGSVHYVKVGASLFDADGKEGQERFLKSVGDKYEFARRYFDAVVRHVQKGEFQIIGHFDVITKFGLYDGDDPLYRRLAAEALEEVLKSGRFLEVNTGAMARGYRENPYPDKFLLRLAAKNGAKAVLSGDAHRPDRIAFGFSEAVRLLKECGFSSVWRFSKGAFCEEKIH